MVNGNGNTDTRYRLDWQELKSDWLLWLLIAGLFAAAIVIYPQLPDQVPRHWNIRGQVDGYWPSFYGAFFPPVLALGLYVLLLVTPLLDPKRDNYARFAGAYRFLRWSLVLFSVLMFIVTVMAAMGYGIKVDMLVKASVSILFIIVGNYMGQFRHNYFVGIKTPWTLASEEVWDKTHRSAARLWVLCGLICLAMAPVSSVWGAWVFMAAIAAMAILPVFHSYLLFKRMNRN